MFLLCLINEIGADGERLEVLWGAKVCFWKDGNEGGK